MERIEMLAKLEAGELPIDVCLDKYRDIYCRVQNGEEFESKEFGINTCALCEKYYCHGCNGTCPLDKSGSKCIRNEDSPYKKLMNLITAYEYNGEEWNKEKVLDALENMIAALKDAKKYEERDIKSMSNEELKKYEQHLNKIIEKSHAEILQDDEEWVESAYTAKDLENKDEVVPVTSTNDYDYYANLKWQIVYRVKKE